MGFPMLWTAGLTVAVVTAFSHSRITEPTEKFIAFFKSLAWRVALIFPLCLMLSAAISCCDLNYEPTGEVTQYQLVSIREDSMRERYDCVFADTENPLKKWEESFSYKNLDIVEKDPEEASYVEKITVRPKSLFVRFFVPKDFKYVGHTNTVKDH